MAHQSSRHTVSYFLDAIRMLSIIAALGVMTAQHEVAAADFSADPSVDSKIQLVENSGHGAYQSYVITMSTRLGATIIRQQKDDEKSESSMPYDEYAALWQYLRELDVGNMSDPARGSTFPGQSQFQYTFQIGDESLTLSAYGVDLLSDTRYRDIARRILAIGEKYSQ